MCDDARTIPPCVLCGITAGRDCGCDLAGLLDRTEHRIAEHRTENSTTVFPNRNTTINEAA